MILTYGNVPCIAIKKLDHLGPEPHYEALYKNIKLILVVHDCGLVGQFIIKRDGWIYTDGFYNKHRDGNRPASYSSVNGIKDTKYFVKGLLHRTDGPAHEHEENSGDFDWYDEFDKFYLEGKHYRDEKSYLKAVKEFNDSKLPK